MHFNVRQLDEGGSASTARSQLPDTKH